MIENNNPVLEIFGQDSDVARDSGAEQAEVRGKRILLVEDEQPIRACMRMMLELKGHQVTEASNGAEALKLFTMVEFDLVMTDFEMPAMKGNMLAANIKLLAPSLPILMVTASASARPGPENPVDALLNKPFTLAELHCVVRKLLSGRPEPARPGIVPALESPSLAFVPDETALCSPAAVTVS